MEERDVAIIGTSVLAALLAISLVRDHRKSVLLVTDRSRPYRLARDMPASFGFFLNANAWHVLRACRDDGQRLIADIGGRWLVRRRDLHLGAVSAAGAQALDHVTQMARFYGQESESVSSRQVRGSTAGCVVRGVSMFDPARFWLKFRETGRSADISLTDIGGLSLGFGASGGGDISANGQTYRAKRIVLVDNEAIANFSPSDLLASSFAFGQDSVIGLSQRGKERGELYVPEFDLRQFASGRFARIVGISGGRDAALATAVRLLPEFDVRHITAMSSRTTISVRGGGPLAGRGGSARPFVIAGFGLAGPFFAPALARLIADAPTRDEERLFQSIAPDAARQSRTGDLVLPLSLPAGIS
ncbi:MAG: hypothetical protein H6873_07245 [Hyphomicrobiaceae bacterium]|nr:hypothetical protein [Hyphomicrobiaceae bacterium]